MSRPAFLTGKVKKPSGLKTPQQILLYGNPKAGKTWLAASASDVPELAPTVILDTEESTTGTITDFKDKNLEVWSIRNFSEFNQARDYLLNDEHEFKTIVVDTFNVAYEWAIDHFKARKSGYDVWPAIEDWGIRQTIVPLKAAAPLSIIVSHVEWSNENTESIHRSIAIPGKAKNKILAKPDIVGYVERGMFDVPNDEGQVVRRPATVVHFDSDVGTVVGHRFSGLLPSSIGNPTMKKIFDYINKKEGK